MHCSAEGLERPQCVPVPGVAQYALGDLEDATKTFELAVQVNTDDVQSWVHLGNCYLYQKRLPEAVEALEVAVEQKGSVENTYALVKARNWMASWKGRDDSVAQVQQSLERALREGRCLM